MKEEVEKFDFDRGKCPLPELRTGSDLFVQKANFSRVVNCIFAGSLTLSNSNPNKH